MVVVVLRSEEQQISDRHGLTESRVERSPRQLGFIHPFTSSHQLGSGPLEISQEVTQRSRVVPPLPGCPVLQICGPQRFQALVKIVEAACPQILQV
jgi:hypothetical protein